MLTQEQIEQNKERFLALVRDIKVEGADLTGLENWLVNKSDFFTAPASTRFHTSYEGGLCEHSLNVYDALCKLASDFASKEEMVEGYDEEQDGGFGFTDKVVKKCLFTQDTLKIVALFHDIAKANYYETYQRNVKDDQGKWTQVTEYKVRDNRFIYGNHEMTSEFMIHNFIPLTVEESVAILHHHAGMSKDCAQDDISAVYNKYTLAVLLHLADMVSCYVSERIE